MKKKCKKERRGRNIFPPPPTPFHATHIGPPLHAANAIQIGTISVDEPVPDAMRGNAVLTVPARSIGQHIRYCLFCLDIGVESRS